MTSKLSMELIRRLASSGVSSSLTLGNALGQTALRSLDARAGSTVSHRSSSSAADDSTAGVSNIPQQEDIAAACILERLPVIVRPAPEYEVEFQRTVYEAAFKLHRPVTSPYSPIEPKQVDEDQAEPSPANVWAPGPSRTPADEAGDSKSLHRSLDERLFLFIRPKGAAPGTWTLPTASHREGETIRMTAERALQGAVGSGVDAYFVGNSPAAHLAKSETGGKQGATFFHRAQLLGGKLSLGTDVEDFAWINQSEVPQYLKEQPALSALLQQLLKN